MSRTLVDDLRIAVRHTPWAARRPRFARAFALALALAAPPAIVSASTPDQNELSDSKAYWQERYRGLLTEAAELRVTIERETELYADANRRNYRRGKKRHVHRVAAEEAKAELARIEAELATIEDEGRRAGALPGWFYEVELELEEGVRRPPVAEGPGDDGRNPLYLENLEKDSKRDG